MMKKTVLLSTALLLSLPVWANNVPADDTQRSNKPIAPYGDNPNLLHVFAYKAQEGVINTAEKVGEVTEKGIAKVKPAVDKAWGNTKSTASNTVEKVDQGATQLTQNANQKIQQTKEVLGGTPQQSAPIVQQPLSQSSSADQVTHAPAASTPQAGAATTYGISDL